MPGKIGIEKAATSLLQQGLLSIARWGEENMQKTSLKLGLFKPGMTHLHRVGLAGLYMTLTYLKQNNLTFEGASWTLDEKNIRLDFENGYSFFEWLFKKSFRIDGDGLIDFLLSGTTAIGDKEKFVYHNSVLNTFLQHTDTVNKRKETNRVLDFEDKKIIIKYKPVKWYYLQGKKPSWKIKSTAPTLDMLFDDKGFVRERIKIKGLHFPGAVERHSGLIGTEIEISPENLLCLIYAPTASIYYQMAHKGPDGKYDKKLKFAIVIPHIVDMKKYSTCFQRYLKIPLKKLSANSLGDAALACIVELKARSDITKLGVSGCTVVSMGTVKWSDKQKTRTKVFTINRLYEDKLKLFDIAYKCLPNRVIIIEKTGKEQGDKYFVATSICRGLIANNIALELEWFKPITEGPTLVVGQLDDDNAFEIVSGWNDNGRRYLTVLDGKDGTEQAKIQLTYMINDLQLADMDKDGINEIVIQKGGLSIDKQVFLG